MTTAAQHPTSFRFTDDELRELDELALLIYARHGGLITVSRKAALVVAIHLTLADERTRSRERRAGAWPAPR